MFSKRSLEGEILIDHRASPGLTAEDVDGFGPVVGKGEVFESAVLTCSHCQAAIVLNPDRTRDRGYCGKCDRYLCDGCEFVRVKTLACHSMAKRFDELGNAIERFGSSSPLLFK